jgi:CO/xanthine dehydrogenase Mo-binding subunit
MPGVVKIFTGADFDAVGGIPSGWQVTDRHDPPTQEPKHPVLAHGKVRHVGEPIAAVVADTLEQARDAAEALEGDIAELPAVVDMKAAARDDAPKVHDDLTSNLCYDWGFVEANREAVNEAFSKAAHVTSLELVSNRLVANPMEPRVAVGDYDPGTDEHTLYTTSQNPHVIRLLMGAFVLGITGHKLRVVAPDVGGGFGTKSFHYQEEAFCTFAAKTCNRPVKWGDATLAAYVPRNYPMEIQEPGLEETAFYDPSNFTYPAGAYACEVEVDPDTGKVTIEKFTAVDDFGNVVNPMIVTGQVHGGLSKGIGQALLENCAYDENGQLLSASYMEYAMPRADDLPNFAVDHSCLTPCTHNTLGVKGCGEAGAIGAPPSVVNAVTDALQSRGKSVSHIDMPLTPARVWAVMQ